jgi:putative spermidine/putrescine transport system ATP-binding protein
MGQATAQGDHRYLDVVAVRKAFRGQTVMEGMNFRMARGELVSLLGPSGCGKTTLLRIIAGLMSADEGSVILVNRNITDLPPHRRNVSVVFQNYALFPHLSVAENVAFGLRARGRSKTEVAGPVREALALVRMEEFGPRPVAGLSGGQQQRVAVARALAVQPDLLLLDEPFSALDRKLREAMQVELKALLRDRGITAIFVTHDQDEAMAVSDRIAVMNAGRIEQFADPAALYSRPVSPFVMDFVGLSTRLTGRITAARDGRIEIATRLGTIHAPGSLASGSLAPGAEVLVSIRPELIGLEPTPGGNSIAVVLEDVTVLGARTLLYGRGEPGERIICDLPGIRTGHARGSQILLHWSPGDTQVHEARP